MIEESCNLTGQKAYLSRLNQRQCMYQMLPFLDDYLHVKNLRYPLIPSRDVGDHRIL